MLGEAGICKGANITNGDAGYVRYVVKIIFAQGVPPNLLAVGAQYTFANF
jgi:hypothetical protein